MAEWLPPLVVSHQADLGVRDVRRPGVFFEPVQAAAAGRDFRLS